MSDVDVDALKKLREPFAENQIGKLPKPYKKDSPRGNCPVCGGFHGLPAAHLDFVGHAALTDRFLDADLEWTWKPMAVNEFGLPLYDQFGGLWIWLTIGGVTRPGYGNADGKTGGNAVKEAIGDALRNGGMRFGAALDLWHKGDLHDAEQQVAVDAALDEANAARGELLTALRPLGWDADKLIARFKSDYAADLLKSDAAMVRAFQAALKSEAEAEAAVGTPVEQETK